MEIEENVPALNLSKEDVQKYVRQKLKAFIANSLLKFEKRVVERYEQSGRPVPSFVSEGTMALFREFEDVSEKYISMFELYCERNILSLRIPDTQVSSAEDFCDEEKELDRKLEKRKRELLECYRKKNILDLQRQLVLSDFGRALARLGALAEEFPVDRLKEDVESFQNYQAVCQSARELIDALRKNEEELVDQSWMEEKEDVHPDMIKGLMQCFDDAGLL